MKMVSLLGVLVILVAIVLPLKAQDSPQDFLTAHNDERATVGVGPLVWDDTVAAYAQDYANLRSADCLLELSPNRPYGENLATSPLDISGVDAVNNLWIAEKAYYNYATNTCDPGRQCGLYTQIVWKNTLRLGCAKVACSNGGTFIICSYDPSGDIFGERPY